MTWIQGTGTSKFDGKSTCVGEWKDGKDRGGTNVLQRMEHILGK